MRRITKSKKRRRRLKQRRRRARRLLKPWPIGSGTMSGEVVRTISLSFLHDRVEGT